MCNFLRILITYRFKSRRNMQSLLIVTINIREPFYFVAIFAPFSPTTKWTLSTVLFLKFAYNVPLKLLLQCYFSQLYFLGSNFFFVYCSCTTLLIRLCSALSCFKRNCFHVKQLLNYKILFPRIFVKN